MNDIFSAIYYKRNADEGEVMSAPDKAMWLIMANVATWNNIQLPYPLYNVNEVWGRLKEEYPDDLQDATEEVRTSGEVANGIEEAYDRHYEIDMVAHQLPDKTWICHEYWHGGGKHGCPESVPWIDDAFDIECVKEEKVVEVKRVFLR